MDVESVESGKHVDEALHPSHAARHERQALRKTTPETPRVKSASISWDWFRFLGEVKKGFQANLGI
jgi:hypothetical protein